MTGTPSQIEWAEEIKQKVNAEFDRVANAVRSVADSRVEAARLEAKAVLAILEEKRAEVLAKDQAGYFIRDWYEITDQVRRMIGADLRFRAIQAARTMRRKTAGETADL